MSKKNYLYNPETTGNTNQVVYTPQSFLNPIRRILTKSGNFSWDFAASEPNVCECFFTEQDNSLEIPWSGLTPVDPGWLNPPFSYSKQFLRKCSNECDLDPETKIVTLTQCAASCSYWYEKMLVFGNPNSILIFLNGRIPFEGFGGKNAKTDCVVTVWSKKLDCIRPEDRIWILDWRKEDCVPMRPWNQEADEKLLKEDIEKWIIRKLLFSN